MEIWSVLKADYCLLFFIIFTNSLLSVTICAPVDTDNSIHKIQWWRNACNPQIVQKRHGRSPHENQLNIMINKIEFFIRELNKLYPKTQVPNIGLRWLNLKKIKKQMDSYNNTIQGFHHSLQIFAIYMNKLKTVEIKTDAKFNRKKRSDIYLNATKNLQLVLCEYENVLRRNNTKLHFVRESQLSTSPKSTMDLSSLKMTDRLFFNKMRKFLRNGRRILRRLKKGKKHKKKKNKT